MGSEDERSSPGDEDEQEWRKMFPSLQAYVHTSHMCGLVMTEKNAACLDIDEEWTHEEKTDYLVRRGFCIPKADAVYVDKDDNSGFWRFQWHFLGDRNLGSRFKKGAFFILSRVGPDVDGWQKHRFRVVRKSQHSLDVEPGTKFPAGADDARVR